jgi:hypothetical protein
MATGLMKVFTGYTKAHGVYGALAAEPDENGKILGKLRKTVREDVTLAKFEAHVAGENGIGIIPIREDNSVWWGAIDVDIYDGFEHREMALRVARLKLPLVTCRTKSGGCHLYCFAAEPVPAAKMISKLRDIRAHLGFHPDTEIFPKQHTVKCEEGDLGSWINIPYFNGMLGLRYAFSPKDGDPLSLEDFLATVEEQRASVDWFSRPLITSLDIPQGPPCLQHLVQLGFPPGTRNQGLFNLAVYAKKSNPEGWEATVDEMNQKYMTPPLGSEEVATVIKSHKKKDFSYRCGDQPIASHCNSELCRTRRYGVGQSNVNLPTFGRLAQLVTSPPLWFWEVNGARIELTTNELQDPVAFQRKCMEKIRVMPPIPKRDVWSALVNEKMMDLDIIPAPAEASPEGQFWEHVETFCTRTKAMTRDEMLTGRPWTDGGRTHFRMKDLLMYFKRQQFKSLTDAQMTNLLNQAGSQHGRFNLKGKTCNWISIPAFEVQSEPLDVPESLKVEAKIF